MEMRVRSFFSGNFMLYSYSKMISFFFINVFNILNSDDSFVIIEVCTLNFC